MRGSVDSHHVLRRRGFFRALLGEIAVEWDEVLGTPHFRLTQLSEYRADRLARIRPVILPDVEIIAGEREILAKRLGRGRGQTVVLFERGATELFVFNRMNGYATIGEIAQALAERRRCSYEVAFGIVRDLFLRLVKSGVSVPDNPEGA